jgi:hypothetical protein
VLGYRPRVFVSYAHDSVAHKENVLSLARVLRECGVVVHLDQEFAGRQDWSLWALRQIQDADFVVVVASAAYRLRPEGRAASDEGRGSQAEAAILRDKLTEDLATWTRKILPVVLPGASVADIPGFLQPYAATHYLVGEPTPAGVAELVAAMSVRPRQLTSRTAFVKRRRLVAPAGVFVAVALLVTVVVIWAPWSSDAANEWHAKVRGNGVSLVPAAFACTSGVDDKIDLDTGLRGHGVQPQIPYASCASEGGLADLIVDENEIHSASKYQDTIVLVPRDAGNPDGAACHAMIISPDANLQHSLPLGDLRAGDRLCVRTDKGHVALVTIRKISADSHVLIDFVLWEKP